MATIYLRKPTTRCRVCTGSCIALLVVLISTVGAFGTPVNKGFAISWISDVVIDPSQPQTLYAATPAGVFKSENGAGLWTPVGLVDSTITALAIDPSQSLILYAGTAGPGPGFDLIGRV